MKLRLSTRLKIFLIAICIIISGQMVYSVYNVRSFQQEYVETLRDKCRRLGSYLKDDVEYVIGLNIPLTKLIKLENTLKEILGAIPELAFIEITDNAGYVLYYADRNSMGRVPPGTRPSATLSERTPLGLEKYGLGLQDIDTILSITHPGTGRPVGRINLRLDPRQIIEKSLEILLDMITVILTSLLITFEMLGFFVSYSISAPLETIVNDARYSMNRLVPLPARNFLFMAELDRFTERFNNYITRYLQTIGPYVSAKLFYPDILEKSERETDRLNRQVELLQREQRQGQISPLRDDFPLTDIQDTIARIQARLRHFSEQITEIRLLPSQRTPQGETLPESPSAPSTPYAFIRPLLFMFVMADGFSISFFPLFADSLYTPIAGMSREMVMGLPISMFMFFLATSMPLAGSISDRVGWRKPLMVGILINAAGLMLTSVSQNIWHLLAFRSLTALGFGITYMACQRFIIDNTSAKTRAAGMAAFVAAFFSGDICGTVVGGMLADRIGYRNVFMLSGLISMCSWLLAFFILQKSKQEEKTPGKIRSGSPAAAKTPLFPFRQAFSVIRDRDFASLVFLQAIPAKLILVGFLYFMVPIYLKHLGLLQSNIGRVIMCYGVLLVFMGPILTRFFNNPAHRRHYIMGGGALTGVSLMSFFFFSGLLPLLASVIMLGVAHSLSVSAQSSLISETAVISDIGSGTGMGLFRFWERTGNVAGPLLVGFLNTRMNYELVIIILGGISLTGSIVFGLLTFLRKQKKEKRVSV